MQSLRQTSCGLTAARGWAAQARRILCVVAASFPAWFCAWDARAQASSPPAQPSAPAAQESPADAAFAAAARAFEDGFFERAEREFGVFVEQYPDSAKVGEAVLLQARAALRRQQPQRAVALLLGHQAQGAALADRYVYWLAEAYLQNTNYAEAADTFARLAREHPSSVRLLEAGYGEAVARFKMRQLPEAIARLQDADGTFRRAAAARPDHELVVRGELLLAEALMMQGEAAAAAVVLEALGQRELLPAVNWRRLHLLCQVRMAEGRLPVALSLSTNLSEVAAQAGVRTLMADSVAWQGSILEALDRLPDAILVYEKNLAEDVPVDRRREALLKVTQLTLRLGLFADAENKLAVFFTQYPQDTATDAGLLTYGELHLKQALAALGTNVMLIPTPPPAPVTNLLDQAQARFRQLLTNHPQSALIGQARLNEGWCLWLKGRVAESKDGFSQAMTLLPFSPDQAVATFKLADAEFYLKDYTNALTHYRVLLRDFVEVSAVRLTLFERALYQVTRASLELGDLAGATNALEQLLKEHPESALADRAMLLVGQSLGRLSRFAQARAILESCLERYPQRELVPEVELALARLDALDQQWIDAIRKYENWLARFPAHPMLPRAQFNLAWANAQAGFETNAFQLFTNFVGRFPDETLAARARFWLADFFFSKQDYVNAQLHYQDAQLLASPLAYRARMMAGRAAYAGERWADAMDNFKALLNDNQCPSNIVVEALFGLGDTYTRQASGQERPAQKYEEAIAVFTKIPQLYPADPRVPNAWGRIGDCYYTLSATEPKNYEAATNAYQQILQAPAPDAPLRSQALVRLAMVQERLARTRPSPEKDTLLSQALDRYLDVVYSNPPSFKPEDQPDPFWLKEAGLAAAKLAEEQNRWQVAVNLYQRLIEVLPPLSESLQKRIERAREKLVQQ